MGLPRPLWMAARDGDYFKPTAHQINDNYEGSCGQRSRITPVSIGTVCVCVCVCVCVRPVFAYVHVAGMLGESLQVSPN